MQSDRSQLRELLEQLPESQEDARTRIEELVASYETIEDSLDEVAQRQGVEDAVSRAVQQGQETAGQAGQQAQDEGVSPMVQSSRRDKVKGAATSVAGRALEIVGSLTGNKGTKVKGFVARRKGAFDKKRGGLKDMLKR